MRCIFTNILRANAHISLLAVNLNLRLISVWLGVAVNGGVIENLFLVPTDLYRQFRANLYQFCLRHCTVLFYMICARSPADCSLEPDLCQFGPNEVFIDCQVSFCCPRGTFFAGSRKGKRWRDIQEAPSLALFLDFRTRTFIQSLKTSPLLPFLDGFIFQPLSNEKFCCISLLSFSLSPSPSSCPLHRFFERWVDPMGKQFKVAVTTVCRQLPMTWPMT